MGVLISEIKRLNTVDDVDQIETDSKILRHSNSTGLGTSSSEWQHSAVSNFLDIFDRLERFV